MIDRLCPLILTVLVGSPSALAGQIRRYEVKTRLSAGWIDPKLESEALSVVDIWEGENEHVLLSAGLEIQVVFGADGKGRSPRRRFISSDIREFERLSDGKYRIVLRDSPDPLRGVSFLIQPSTGILTILIRDQKSLAITAQAAVQVLPEAGYKSARGTGNPVAVESGNRPVGFHEFFRNKSTELLGPSHRRHDDEEPKGSLIVPPLPERRWLTSEPVKRERPEARTIVERRRPAETVPLPGQEAAIEELLARDEKPRIADVLSLMRAVKAVNPDYDLARNPFASYLQAHPKALWRAMDQMNRVREDLEKAFPGAIWYLLGRDVYLLSDALEAVYLARGETGRVVRLPASAPSFYGSSLATVNGFLKTNGIDVDEMNEASVPRIILDISSYSKAPSQSRHLMRAAYARWVELGRDPAGLLGKLNFVNVSASHRHTAVESADQVQEFLSELRFEPEPDRVLSVPAPMDFLYTDAWHGLYRAFRRDSSGRVVTDHDAANSRHTRLHMLGEQWAILAYFGEKLVGANCAERLQRKVEE